MSLANISNNVKPKTSYILYILSGCLLIGLIIIFFTNNRLRNNTNETSGRSWIQTNAIGYILSATALLGIIPCFIKLSSPKNEILKDQKSTSIVAAFADAFTRYLIYPLPIIITMLVFIFAAIQLLTFQDRLAKHHVANEYFTWINTFFFLTIVQILILSYDVRDAISNKSSNNSSRKYIIYLLGLFNFIILGITQVILQFFSTDG